MNWTEAVKLMDEGKGVTLSEDKTWKNCYLTWTNTKRIKPNELWNPFNAKVFKNEEYVEVEGYYSFVMIDEKLISIYFPTEECKNRTDWVEFK